MGFNLAFKGLNGLVHLVSKKKSGFSARVQSHFKSSLPHNAILQWLQCGEVKVITSIFIYIYIYICRVAQYRD